MHDLVIFGTGDIAKLAHRYFTRDTEYRVAGFTVDRAYREGEEFLGLPLVDFEEVEERFPPQSCQMFVALSYAQMNRRRAERYAAAKDKGFTLASYVSPRCTWLTDEPHGDNCFILEDNTVQPFVRIGSDVTLWSGNHIGHDSVIDDHCFISSHVVVSGRVHIRAFCFIGVNATLRNAITLALGTLVGAGAIVLKDTEENGVYVSRPANLVNRNSVDVEI